MYVSSSNCGCRIIEWERRVVAYVLVVADLKLWSKDKVKGIWIYKWEEEIQSISVMFC